MFRTALRGFAVVFGACCHVVDGTGVRGVDERGVPGFERVQSLQEGVRCHSEPTPQA